MNILSPAYGEPIIVPTQDVVLGLYYMTRDRINAKGEGKVLSDIGEVHRLYSIRAIDIHAKIEFRINECSIDGEGQKLAKTFFVDITVGLALI